MNPALEAKIYLRCPILYRDRKAGPQSNLMCFGFEVGEGWYELIYNASVDIESVVQEMKNRGIAEHNLHSAVQVKEKFGALRFYVDNETEQISDIIEKAEALSAVTCDTCGKPGKIIVGGWLRTLCSDCEAKNKK